MQRPYRLDPFGHGGGIYGFHESAPYQVQQQQRHRRLARSRISLRAIIVNPQRGKLGHQGNQIHAAMLEAATYCGFRDIVPSSLYASPHTCKVQFRRGEARRPHENLNARVRSFQQLARDAARAQRGLKGKVETAFNRITQPAKTALPRSRPLRELAYLRSSCLLPRYAVVSGNRNIVITGKAWIGETRSQRVIAVCSCRGYTASRKNESTTARNRSGSSSLG